MAEVPFIAVTDSRWIEFLSSQVASSDGRVDEVNFWQPKGQTPMVRLASGAPVFFRTKSPSNRIAGYGFFSHFSLLTLEMAWDAFGTGNGDADYASFLIRIGEYRGQDLLNTSSQDIDPVGCNILRDAVFWPESRWIPWSEDEGWKPNIVKGKREKDPALASRLIAEIQFDQMQTPAEFDPAPFTPIDADEREFLMARTAKREGQGTFRTRLLDSFTRRCAITGEHTEIVLDAAHIQPYLGPRSNHPQNGLLLTKEFHALFDAGYVTVTPEYEVRVSPRLKEKWDNGHRYYPVDGQRLIVLPKAPLRPSPEALAWHGERRFLA
jgi:putative restriction endonuclease